MTFLLEEIRLRGKNPELQSQIESLSRRFGILTPYTAFLVIEDQSPQAAEQLERYRREFEGGAVSGTRGVGLSYRLALAKEAPSPAAIAPNAEALAVGFDRDFGAKELRTELPGVDHSVKRLRRVADKVFIRRKDAFSYATMFDESMRAQIVDVRRWSEEYVALLDRHPGIGQYLAAGWNMVLVVDGKAYRIHGHD